MDKIEELQELVQVFLRQRNWNKFHRPKNLAMSIAIEAAELMEIFQWISVPTSMERMKDEKVMARVEEELADIFIYVLSLASTTGIDLEKAVRDKMKINEGNFPEGKEYYF